MTNMAITRRGFMKAAATATAALGVAGAPVLLDEVDQAFADSIPKREKHKTACHGCTNCCPVCVYTEDGVVVKIEGDPDGPLNKGGVCLKCLSQIQTVYSRAVMLSMKRVGDQGQEPVGGDFLGRATDLAGEQICSGCRKYARTPTGVLAGVAVPISNGRRGVSTTRSEAATPWPLVPVSVLCPEISFPRRRLGSTAA